MSRTNDWDRAYLTQGRLWGGAPMLPPLPSRACILELGCGNGKTTSVLSGKTNNLIALDFSMQACRLARQQLAGGERVEVITADARVIPLAAGSMDAVVAYHVAGHLLQQDRTRLLHECARVIKDGGIFLFCDFSVGDFRYGSGREVEDRTYRRGNGIITHYFTEEEVRSLAGCFTLTAIRTHRWQLRIRGRDHARSEIHAVFEKA